MAYVGYAGQGGPAGTGAVRSQVDPGINLHTPQYLQQQGQQTDLLSSIYGQWNAAVGLPNQMLTQAQIDQLGNQRDLTYMQGGLQSQNASQQAMFGLAGLGLQQQGLGVQQGALARQMALLPQQYGLQQAGFDIQGKQLDVQGGQLNVQGKRLDEQQKEAWLNAAQQQRGLTGQASSTGTWNMPGTSQGFADIKQTLANAMANIGFGRESLGLERQGLGLQREQLGLNRQGAALTYQEQVAQQGDAKKMLDIQSQKLGLSGDEIRARLQNQLDQIGIGTQVSVDQLLSEMYKTQQGGLSAFAPLFGTMASAQGIVIPGAE